MVTKNLKKQVISIFVLIIIFFVGKTIAESIEFRIIDPNNFPDEFAKMSDAVKANYNKINTWQGKISRDGIMFYSGKTATRIVKELSHAKEVNEPKELAKKYKGMHEFKLDAKANRLFTHYTRIEPAEYIDTSTQMTYAEEPFSDRQTIKTDNYELECYADYWKQDGTVTHRKVVKTPVSNSPYSYWNTDLSVKTFGVAYKPVGWGHDPRGFFEVGTPVWVLLSQLSENFRSFQQGKVNKVYNVMLEKSIKGELYRVSMALPGQNQWQMIFVLDGSKEFNPVEIETKYPNGVTRGKITTKFTDVKGVFLPNESQSFRYKKDGSLIESSTAILSDMQVNMTLPENIFSVDNLGLKNGDTIMDKIDKKEYKYENKKLVFVKDINEPAKPNK